MRSSGRMTKRSMITIGAVTGGCRRTVSLRLPADTLRG
jgi:hypothetical protein